MIDICYMPIKSDKEASKLYTEWTGFKPSQFITLDIPINMNTVIAREGGYYEGRVVGAAQLIVIYDPIWIRRYGLVENVFVSELYRGKGIAQGLMKELEIIARNKECAFIKLTSALDKKAGHALYRSLKYTEGVSFKKWLQ